MTCIQGHIEALSNPEIEEAERKEHIDRLNDCRNLSTAFRILDMKRERVTGYMKRCSTSGLNFTPELRSLRARWRTCVRSRRAVHFLRRRQRQELGGRAYKWLAALAEVSGYEAAFPEGFTQDPVEVLAMASHFGVIRPSK